MTRYGFWSTVGGRSNASWGKTPGFAARNSLILREALVGLDQDSTVYVARRDDGEDRLVYETTPEDDFDSLLEILS